MAEEPHPIKLDDGNVAPVVEHQAAAALKKKRKVTNAPDQVQKTCTIALFILKVSSRKLGMSLRIL